jgi:hypothetical protein
LSALAEIFPLQFMKRDVEWNDFGIRKPDADLLERLCPFGGIY